MVKIRIEFTSGSVLEGILPDNLSSTFAYGELPPEITVVWNDRVERRDSISQILRDDTIVQAFGQGFVLADDRAWRKLVGQLFGSSGLDDYHTLRNSLSTATSGTVIHP